MYIVVVYDVGVERVNKVKKFLRMHLNWVQNSVFEGEVTLAEFERIKEGRIPAHWRPLLVDPSSVPSLMHSLSIL